MSFPSRLRPSHRVVSAASLGMHTSRSKEQDQLSAAIVGDPFEIFRQRCTDAKFGLGLSRKRSDTPSRDCMMLAPDGLVSRFLANGIGSVANCITGGGKGEPT